MSKVQGLLSLCLMETVLQHYEKQRLVSLCFRRGSMVPSRRTRWDTFGSLDDDTADEKTNPFPPCKFLSSPPTVEDVSAYTKILLNMT